MSTQGKMTTARDTPPSGTYFSHHLRWEQKGLQPTVKNPSLGELAAPAWGHIAAGEEAPGQACPPSDPGPRGETEACSAVPLPTRVLETSKPNELG